MSDDLKDEKRLPDWAKAWVQLRPEMTLSHMVPIPGNEVYLPGPVAARANHARWQLDRCNDATATAHLRKLALLPPIDIEIDANSELLASASVISKRALTSSAANSNTERTPECDGRKLSRSHAAVHFKKLLPPDLDQSRPRIYRATVHF